MIGTVLEVFRAAREFWPRRWSNVRVRLDVAEMGLILDCDAKGPGLIRLTIWDPAERMVAYVEGPNEYPATIEVGCNSEGMTDSLLTDCFQMARYYREFQRTGTIEFSRHYQHFRTRAAYRWERLNQEELEAMEEA